MGLHPMNPMAQLGVAGNLATDKGIRHPWNMANDVSHAMPGRPKREIGAYSNALQNRGAKDVARGIAEKGSLFSGMRTARGLRNLGEAQHGIEDIGPHFERPLQENTLAAAKKGGPKAGLRQRIINKVVPAIAPPPVTQFARNVAQKLPGGGSLGTLISGVEHAQAGLYRDSNETGGSASHTDDFRPAENRIDKRSANRAAGVGRANKRKILSELQALGMSPEKAAAEYDEFRMRAQVPGKLSRGAAKITQDAGFLGRQAARPVKRAAKLLRYFR